jgi:hypothetical protein
MNEMNGITTVYCAAREKNIMKRNVRSTMPSRPQIGFEKKSLPRPLFIKS